MGSWNMGVNINPFSWGGNSPSIPTFSAMSGGVAVVAKDGTNSAAATTAAAHDPEWWEVLAGTGTSVMNSIFQYKLQNQQIKAGQVPSIATDMAGRPSGQVQALVSAASSSGFTWLIVAVAVVLVLSMVRR